MHLSWQDRCRFLDYLLFSLDFCQTRLLSGDAFSLGSTINQDYHVGTSTAAVMTALVSVSMTGRAWFL
jgi:hypothetical protein